MNRRGGVARGVGALAKSALLVGGVPASLVKLWSLAPPLHRPISIATFGTAAAGVHVILVIVACLWAWASIALVRDLVEAVRRPDGSRDGSWSRRWAAAIVGLVLTITAGSAAATAVTFDRGGRQVTSSARAFADRPPSPADSATPAAHLGPSATVKVGECLDGLAARVTGERGRWPEIARANLGAPQPTGGRFVDANLVRPGWCLELPPSSSATADADPDRPVSGRRLLEELAILGVGVLITGAVARRVRALRRLTESARAANTRLDRPPAEVLDAEMAIGPCGDGLLVDWIEAALRVAGCVHHGAGPADVGPDVRLVRAGPDGVELLLASPVTPPAPMRASDDGRWWILDASELGAPHALAPEAGRIVPWLVPVGEDADAVYLVATGPGRHLVVEGASADRAAAIRGITAGLRALPWATELEIELLGIDPPPPAERCFQLFASSPATLRQLVDRGRAPDRTTVRPPWRPEPLVVALDSEAGAPEPTRLDPDLLAKVAAVCGVVSDHGVGTDRLVVDPDGTGRLLPYGISLSTPLPTRAQSRLLDRLFAAASATVTVAPNTSAPTVTAPSVAPARHGVITLTLLAGPPALSGLMATAAPRDLDRLVELIAYLVLHDHRSTRDAIGRALFAREATDGIDRRVHHVIAAARTLLPRSDDGRPTLSTTAERDVVLDPSVTSDWERVHAAITAARASTPSEAMARLARAFDGVGGVPILDDASTYDWMVREGIGASIRADLVDGAHHLATLALAADDIAVASLAIERGLTVDPIAEILVRDAMVLRDRVGDRRGVAALYGELERALDALASAEPSTETRALLRALTDPAN